MTLFQQPLRKTSLATPLVLSLLGFAAVAASAAPEDAQGLADDLGGQVFFDARQTGVTKDGLKQTFDGDVVAIGAGTLIAADHLLFDRTTNRLDASGRVVVLSRTQLFLGDTITYHVTTGDFAMTGATMLANDAARIAEVTQRIFGFNAEEVAFERARAERLAETQARKRRLAREARRQSRGGAFAADAIADDLVERYAVLLEQEEQIRTQENPALARLGEERREVFKKRRAFWDESQRSAVQVETPALATAYFHLEGDEITRVRGNDYAARNALFTPCLCDKDEAPAWAFRADRVDAQLGGYADLSHPVLEIKGIPVLYLPFLKVPLKDRRQSGFLLPTVGFERRSGNTFTQPVYFDLSPAADATLTTDVYENRGTRLGLEYRIQQREFSGWDLKVEGIRDRLWMRDRALREDMSDLYREGLAYARGAADGNPLPQPPPAVTARDRLREKLRQRDWGFGAASTPADVNAIYEANLADIDHNLLVPQNTWRGSYGWRGVTFLAPRLSLASTGEVTSDHRYAEELYVPDDYQEAFLGGRDARAFSTAKAQMHLDGKDYYLGLGTAFGDNYQLDERYQGQQLPLRLKAQSRAVSLLPPRAPVPLYLQVSGEHLRITEFQARSAAAGADASLSDGSWRRIKVDTVSPWLTDRIVQVSQFTEGEARYVEHTGLDTPRSETRSWRAGLEFRLPVDGKGELPASFQDEPAADGERTTRHLHHIMDWRLRVSVRPSVVKNGPYTDPTEANGHLAYFASDVPMIPGGSDVDGAISEEERMSRHRRVSLITDHVWKLFRRGFTVVPGAPDAPAAPAPGGVAPATARERARRDLLESLGRPVSDTEDIYDATERRWLIDRYRLSDDYYEAPLTFHGDIAYDFLDAERRERQRREQTETGTAQALAEPWKDPNLSLGINWAGWSFSAATKYSIYLRMSRTVDLMLRPPGLLDSNVELRYGVGKQPNEVGAPPTITRTRAITLVTNLIPAVTTDVGVSRRAVDGAPRDYTAELKVATGITYASPSKCWGLQLARVKDYGYEDRHATYLLRLNVVFMGEQRGLPNMSPGLRRQVGDDPEEEGAG